LAPYVQAFSRASSKLTFSSLAVLNHSSTFFALDLAGLVCHALRALLQMLLLCTQLAKHLLGRVAEVVRQLGAQCALDETAPS
jgi:hypothetical protein